MKNRKDIVFFVFYSGLILSCIFVACFFSLPNDATVHISPYPFPHFHAFIETDGQKVWGKFANGTIICCGDAVAVLEQTVENVNVVGGGVILIKSGKYIITRHHTIVRPYSDWVYFVGAIIYKPRNIMVVGEGDSTVLISDAGVTNPIYVYNAINFTLSNLIVDGAKHLQERPYFDCYALIFNDGGGENIKYHDLLLKNGKYVGIYVGNNDFLFEVSDKAWYCPVRNITIHNIWTRNVGTGILLDHVFGALAYNVTSHSDDVAIGFSSLSWEKVDQTFENVTVIDPVGCVFLGWYPQGKLKNITVYLSRPQNWHLFDFTNASEIILEDIYIYGKINQEKGVFYTNIPEAVKFSGTILIDMEWKP